MKVVLREDVESLGNKGDLLDVADGYARNYLVPRGLAMKATKGGIQQAEAMRRNRAAQDARDREAAEELAGRLTGARIEIGARSGEGGKLFGSVTNADVASAVHQSRPASSSTGARSSSPSRSRSSAPSSCRSDFTRTSPRR